MPIPQGPKEEQCVSMMQKILSFELKRRIAELYSRMENAYDAVARQLNFTCEGCPDNCCDSFFQHHTYIEWAYLWEGLYTLPEAQRETYIERAKNCVIESEAMLGRGERPALMCPVNDEGLCALYSYRLMICRMHGVPSAFMRPDGRKIEFPGCFRCQDLVEGKENIPVVDRTELYRDLAMLEAEFLGHRRHVLPRVKLTLAQMLVQGPPRIPEPC